MALGIGFINGTLVERTKLPSFTITLATYYVLIGAKLGFSKLIVDKVEVGNIQDSSGYDAWFKVFGAEWIRNDHEFGRRDTVYLVGVLLAIALDGCGDADHAFPASYRRAEFCQASLCLS